MDWAALLIIGSVLGGVAAVWWSFRKPKDTRVQSGLLAGLMAGLVLAFQIPSISVDLSSIFSYASQIVTMMMPIVGVGAGISFGFALVAYIIRLFRQVF